MNPDDLCRVISLARFSWTCEADVQDAIEELLRNAGVEYLREESLWLAGDRPDFIVKLDGKRCALEVKTKGSFSSVVRQLFRYADSGQFAGLILATTRQNHLGVPEEFHGLPCWRVRCSGI